MSRLRSVVLGLFLALMVPGCAAATPVAPVPTTDSTAALPATPTGEVMAEATAPSDTETAPTPAEETTPPTEAAEPIVATDTTAQVELLRIAIGADETALTPYAYVFGYPGYQLMKLSYDSLMELDSDNLPQPWLAESVEMSEDGTTYTIILRDGIMWHDGEAFTAEDVKFSYDYYVEHPEASRFATTGKMVASIETPDDLTVVMTLNNPDPTFPLRLADVPILPEHLWADAPDPTTFVNNVGTGPYTLVEHQPDQFYRFEANPDYFMGAPSVQSLVFPIIDDSNTMFSALQAGEIDVASQGVPPELVSQFSSMADLKVAQGAGFSTTLIQFNDERAPFDQPAVRQAIAEAIDRDEIIATVLLDQATLGNPGFIHPDSPYANPDLTFIFDPDAANAALDEAGYVDSDGNGIRETADGTETTFSLLVYADSAINIRVAELIQGYLAAVGIPVSVDALDPDTVDSKVWPDFDVANGRDFDLTLWGWSASVQNNPSRYIELFHSDPSVGSLNIGGYQNEDFDALADTFRSTLSMEDRARQLSDMQAFITEEVPFVTLYYPNGTYAYRSVVYDGYVFIKGLGIVNKLSFLPH